MALPTTADWTLAYFDESNIGSVLSLGGGDLTITPGVSPYFSYTAGATVLVADSRNGTEARLDFSVGIPSQFTVEFEARFPYMPHNMGDLRTRKAGLTVADDAGRGVSLYFATTGLAVARVDDLGSVSALPDTTETTEEISTTFRTIRVAVDSALGRAYVFVGANGALDLRYIVPAEATPATAVDRFRLFVHGTAAEPAQVELRGLRLTNGLLIPDAPPVANAGPDRVAPVGQYVRFDGRASYDVEGAPLSYSWRVVDVPTGSEYASEHDSGASTDDGDADGFTDLLSFSANALPDWVGPGDVLVLGGSRHEISTVDNSIGELTVTTDTIPDTLTDAIFRILRQSLLVGADTETPYAVPDVAGVYRFALTVSDGNSESEPAEVLASIVSARAPLGVEPDPSPIWKALGDEWQYIEGHELFTEFWRGTAQILAGKLLEVWQRHYNYSLRDAQRTFQKKWIAYRPLITEPEPESFTISPRYGALLATHSFDVTTPTVTGLTLVFEFPTAPGASETETVTLTGGSLSTIVSDINTALSSRGVTAYAHAVRIEDNTLRYLGSGGSVATSSDTFSFTPLALPSWVAVGDTLVVPDLSRWGTTWNQIVAVNNAGGEITVADPFVNTASGLDYLVYRMCRLGIRSTEPFRLSASSTATTALGLPTEEYNYLRGAFGVLATDQSYFINDGLELRGHGVDRYDLLVTNGGQSFRINRLLSDVRDPRPDMRVLLFDEIPADITETWEIPSVCRSASVDFEAEGSYPGDLLKSEVYDTEQGAVSDATATVVAQKGTQLAVHLDELIPAVQDPELYEVRVLGVKRRKGLPLPDDVVSIPQLQDLVPQSAGPTIWKEHQHYVLEPLYRDDTGSAVPYLQFRDSVFIDTNLEPPDVFWAELTVFSNDQNVEDLFGRLAGFLRDDASLLPPDFNYVSGVAGLVYAQQRGPSVHAMRVGAQILFGQPFAEVAGVVEEVRGDYSPRQGRILIRDQDGNTPTRSEVVRSYYYLKDPLDLSSTSGLALNPDTDLPWAAGDMIDQFQPIGGGVDIVDAYNDPTWYLPYVRGGLITELERFHNFAIQFNLDLVSIANMALLQQFILGVKPTYTHPLLIGRRNHIDDIDVLDEVQMLLQLTLYDSSHESGHAFMYDDYRGDGTIWTAFDDGVAYYDGLTDVPVDIVQLEMEITLSGGPTSVDSVGYPIFYLDGATVIDVDGTLGPPGGTFVPTDPQMLADGTYQVQVYTKDGNLVLPGPPPPP
jgi:opacity protein-like surface antigen